MTIYEIKYLTEKTNPYYFTRDTMRFFGQTMKSFSVTKQTDGRFLISAPMKNYEGKIIGKSERYYNPINHELELS